MWTFLKRNGFLMGIVLILLWFLPTFSQGSHVVFRLYSDNGAFALEVAGEFPDEETAVAFPDNCTFTFIDTIKNVALWGKHKMNTGVPLISNLGELALPQNSITFYDNSGTLQGRFPSEEEETLLDIYFDIERLIHAYSPDGKSYYIFTRNTVTGLVVFWCLDQKGQMRWNIELNEYVPSRIHTSTKRIIVDDLGTEGVSYENRAFLFDRESGHVIRQYTIAKPQGAMFYSSRQILVVEEQNEFLLFNYGHITSYQLLTGKKIRELRINDILPLLYHDDTEKLLFALHALSYAQRTNSLPDLPGTIITRLQIISTLPAVRNASIWNLSKNLIETLNRADGNDER